MTDGEDRPRTARAALRFASAGIDAGVFVLALLTALVAMPAGADAEGLRILIALAAVLPYAPEAWGGRTLGKCIVGLRVVDGQGRPVSAGRLRRRRMFAGRALIGALALMRDPRGRHDRLAGTFVVHDD